jgi:hypothetical protein
MEGRGGWGQRMHAGEIGRGGRWGSSGCGVSSSLLGPVDPSFEPSLDALSLRSDVISSIIIHSLGRAEHDREKEMQLTYSRRAFTPVSETRDKFERAGELHS